MLRTAKLITLRTSRALGFTSLALHSRWRQNRLLILAYHGTSLDDEHEWNPNLYITPSMLRQRMQLIRDTGCAVVPLDAALRQLYSGDLPPRSVAITVDDGPYDFYRAAYPVIESFGFPVTVYFATYYAVFNRPVYDTMSAYLLWKARGRRVRWPEVFGTDSAIELSGAGLRTAAARLRRYPAERRLGGAAKDALLCRLAELLEIDYPSILSRRLLSMMTLAEARELAARGVQFQLHTHRHGVSLDKKIFEREILENRAILDCVRPSCPSHFCYPSGIHRPEFLPWLREWNVVSATTCEPGMASRHTNALLLPRLVDGGAVTEDEFVSWLSGIATLLPKRLSVEGEEPFLEQRLGIGKTALGAN